MALASFRSNENMFTFLVLWVNETQHISNIAKLPDTVNIDEKVQFI
jgi:hypothetical protein